MVVSLTAEGSGVVIVASPRQGRAEGLFSGRVEPGWKLKDRDVVGDVERGGGGVGGGCAVGLGYKGSAVAGAAAAKAHAPSSCRRALFLVSLFLCGGEPVPHMHR